MPGQTPSTRSFMLHDAGADVMAQVEDVDKRLRATIADSERLNALVELEMERKGTDDYSAVLGGVLAFASALRELCEAASQPGADIATLALAGAAQLRTLEDDTVTFAQAVRDLEGDR
jgi:hypothetical protein